METFEKAGERKMAESGEKTKGERAWKSCFKYLIPLTWKRKTGSRVKMSNHARHVLTLPC